MRSRSLVDAFRALAVVALAAALPIPALAQKAPPKRLATMAVEAGMVTFHTSSPHSLALKVGGKDRIWRQRFAAGETPFFQPFDDEGFDLPDGAYVWELVEYPSLPERSAQEGGRPADGRATHQKAAARGRRQMGSFTLRAGQLVDPTRVEPPRSSAIPEPEGLREAPVKRDDAGAAARTDPSDHTEGR